MNISDHLPSSIFYVLTALFETEATGLQISKRIAHAGKGKAVVGAGTLYTILMELIHKGWVESVQLPEEERLYRITAAGRAAFKHEVQRLETAMAAAETVYHEKGDQADEQVSL